MTKTTPEQDMDHAGTRLEATPTSQGVSMRSIQARLGRWAPRVENPPHVARDVRGAGRARAGTGLPAGQETGAVRRMESARQGRPRDEGDLRAGRFPGLARVAGLLLLITCWALPVHSQQPDPGPEVYGMTGTYYFANQSNVFKSRVWGPQGGAALLLPVKPKWSLLMDGQVSFVEVQEGLHNQLTGHPSVYFYRLNPHVPNEDFTTQSQVAIFPSLVRMVRKRRFSVYLGGGLGVTHLRQAITHRPVSGDVAFLPESEAIGGELQLDPERSDLMRSESFEVSKDSMLQLAPHFSGGVLLNISSRVRLRAGLVVHPTALDAPLGRSVLVGLGFRL